MIASNECPRLPHPPKIDAILAVTPRRYRNRANPPQRTSALPLCATDSSCTCPLRRAGCALRLSSGARVASAHTAPVPGESSQYSTPSAWATLHAGNPEDASFAGLGRARRPPLATATETRRCSLAGGARGDSRPTSARAGWISPRGRIGPRNSMA